MHKKYCQMKRIAALAIFVCIVIASLLTDSFLLVHADHKCVGESCHICIQISDCLKVLKNITELCCVMFFSFGFFRFLYFAYLKIIHIRKKYSTLVGLKVRLDN